MAFKMDGVQVRIERILDDGHITLESIGTSKWSETSERELLSAYSEGRVVVEQGSTTDAVSGSVRRYGRPFSDLSPEIQKEALRRKHYVDALIQHGRLAFTAKILRPLILQTAESMGDPSPPSPITLYRWYRILGNTDDPRALIPRYHSRGPRKALTQEEVVGLFMESLVEVSDHNKAWSIQDVSDRLRNKLDHANQFLPSTDQLNLPCLRTLYRLLDRV